MLRRHSFLLDFFCCATLLGGRFFRNAEVGLYRDYRGRVGVNPATNVNDPTNAAPPHGPLQYRD